MIPAVPRFSLYLVCLLAGLFGHIDTTQGEDCSLVDDGVTLKLENRFFRLTLRPPKGGTSLDFFYKPTGKQFIPKNESLPLFADTATEVGWRGPWVGKAYEYKILVNTPEKVRVHLSGKGSGAFPFVNLHKTITVYRDRCLVQVDHAVEVDVNNMVPAFISPWFHNGLAVVGEQTQYIAPIPSGLARAWDVENQSKSLDYKDITRPWSAMIGKSGTGLGLEMTNYKHLEMVFHAFYQQQWCFEWRFNRVKIQPGARLQSKYWLTPFHGLSGVDGVGRSIVGFLKCPEQLNAAGPAKVALELYSGQAKTCKVTVTAQRIPGDARPLLDAMAELQPNKAQAFPFSFKPEAEGTYVLRCRLDKPGGVVCDFEKPVVVGKPSGKYAMKPAGERLPPEVMEREPMKLSHEVVTPHVKWAKPYARGKVRALILMEILGVRDIVELAQRMDLDYTTVKMSNGDSYLRYYGAPDNYGPPTILECNDCLRTALKKDYDVILVSGIRWTRFSPKNRAAMIGKAKKGTGLVYIGPAEITPDLGEVLGVHGKTSRRYGWRRLVRGDEHFLRNGLPYRVLFPCPVNLYNVEEDLEISFPINTARGEPFLVAREGDCRSVSLLYQPGGLLPQWHGKYEKTWPEYDHGVRYSYWEHYYGLVARSLLWAAEKEPDVTIASIEAPKEPVDARELKARKVTIALVREADGAGAYQAEVVFRNQDYEGVHTFRQKLQLDQGRSSIAAPLPARLGNGPHFADLRLLDEKGRVVNWSTASFEVRSPIRIQSCDLGRRVYSTEDTISAEVSLAGISEDTTTCEVEVVDAHGRVVWRDAAAIAVSSNAPDTQTKLSFEPEFSPITRWHRLDCRLKQGDRTMDSARREFLLFAPQTKRREWDDYVMAATYKSSRIPQYWLADRYNRQLRSLGFTKFDIWEHAFGAKPRDPEVAFDLYQGGAERLAVVCGTSFGGKRSDLKRRSALSKRAYKESGDKLELVRFPCLDDPEFWKDEQRRLHLALETLARFRTESFHLADEDTLTRFGAHGDCCYGPHTLTAFRKWLKEEYYPDLDDLNDEWDTEFESWDEVVPMTREEVRDRGSYAPWADHRSYMETAWARAWNRYKGIARQYAPFCFIGSGGSQIYQADNGLDYWKFYREWEQANVRNVIGWTGKMYRSFPDTPIMTPSSGLSWNWAGPQSRYWVWKVAFEARGAGDSAYPSITKVAPDLSISYSGRSAEEFTRPLRQGVGKLLRKLDIVWDGVAIHYSQPSIHGEFIIGHGQQTVKAHHAWVWILRDLGVDPFYVSYEQVENGELIKGGHKLFIMPFSVAVSRKEAEQIRAFVQQGGAVIGDAMTGIMDGHCKPLDPSPMDEPFGLTRKGEPKGGSGKALIAPGGLLAETGEAVGLNTPFIEDGLAPGRAKAFAKLGDGQPGLIINDLGKGKAIRLGFLLSDYPDVIRHAPQPRNQVLRFAGALLGLAGVSRKVAVTGADEAPLPFCEVWRFRRGSADYVGVLREWHDGMKPKPETVEIRFPAPRRIYSVLRGKYHGETDRVQVQLSPGQPALFALLRERIVRVEVATEPKTVLSSGAGTSPELQYEIAAVPSAGTPGDHVFRVEMLGPDGKARGFYAANVFAERGRAKGTVRLALNDPHGIWKVVARDVVSGTKGVTPFTVK